MKKFLFLLWLLCQFGSAFAQHTYTFNFNEYDSVRTGHYSRIKVLDLRPEKESLGFLTMGALNRKTDIVTEQPFKDMLADHFTKTSRSDEKNELVLALYGFRIEHRYINDEIGTFYFDGDFYSGNEGRYTYVGTVDSFVEIASVAGMAKKIISLAQYLTTGFLQQFGGINPTEKKQLFSEEQITNRRLLENAKYSIYTEQPKRGIYQTVSQFLDNKPVDTEFIKTKLSQGIIDPHYCFYFARKNGRKGDRIDEDDYFAIYDGEMLTTSERSYAVKLSFVNNNFYAFRRLKAPRLTSSGAFMFGAAGALAAHASVIGLYETKFNPITHKFYPIRRVPEN